MIIKPQNKSQAQNLIHDNFLLDIQKSLTNSKFFHWDKDPNRICFHVIQPDRQKGRDLIVHWGPSVTLKNGLNEVTRFFTNENYKRLSMLANIEVKTTNTMSLLLDRAGQATKEAFDNAKSYNNSGRYPFSIGIAAMIKDNSLVCSIITLDGANYRRASRPAIIGTFYNEEQLFKGLHETMNHLNICLKNGLNDTKFINKHLDALEPFYTHNPAHIDYNLLDSYLDLSLPDHSMNISQAWPPSPPNVQQIESTNPPSEPKKISDKILKKAQDDTRLTKGNLKFLNTLAPLITTDFKEFKKGFLSDAIDYSLQILDRNLDRLALIGVLKYETIREGRKKQGYKIKLNKGYL